VLSEGESVDIKVFASSSIAAMTSFLSDSARKDRALNRGSRKHALLIRSAVDESVYQLSRSARTAFFSDLLRCVSEGLSTRCLQVSL